MDNNSDIHNTKRCVIFLLIICLILAQFHTIVNNKIIAAYKHDEGDDKNDLSK